jgi:signal transduction histidine kinase
MGRWNLYDTLLLLTLLINGGLGLLVYLKKGPQRRVHIAFSLLSFALAAWASSILMIYLFETPAWRNFWVRMSFVTSSFIPAAFLYFSIIFPKEKRTISPRRMVLLFFLPALFAILSFTPLMVRSVHWETLVARYGLAHKPFSAYLLLYIWGGIFFLVHSLRHSVGLERLQIKYSLFGMFISALSAISLNLVLPVLGTSRLSNLGPPSTLIMVSFVSYSIVKHRLMDIDIVLKKGTTYVLLILLLFIPAALLILFGQRFFYGVLDPLFFMFLLSLLLLITLLFNQMKGRTEKAVEQLFFRDRYDYRETLAQFSKAMVTILDLESLSRKIIETITQTMQVEKASFYSLEEEKGGYQLLESKNLGQNHLPKVLPKGDPLARHLEDLRMLVIREELMQRRSSPASEGVLETLSLLEAELSIPLVSKGQLMGMINLSHKFNRETYSQEDLELLNTLANQTTIALENARLYDDLKKSKSYIRRADRLASLGTLTAGLAHEIRNPLVAIKTLTQLLPERFDDEEFRSHFLNIASGEVDRISSLVNELLEFARPSDPKFEMENINNIVDGMILLVSTETKKKQIAVTKEYTVDLPPVTVDREQIKQVFLNVLLNAIEATPPNGKLIVRTRSFVKPGGEPHVQIEFTDTGCGIPGEYLEEIFTPFFTTKIKGSGLGLSISNQIIQDHRGYIDVESRVNQGSSFFVNLPINQSHPHRRKSDVRAPSEAANPMERR